MKYPFRAATLMLAVGLIASVGGCVYYPVRSGVIYDGRNGNAVVDYDDSAVIGPGPGYVDYGYYNPYWYGPGWYGYGGPAVSLGFYGGYWGGGYYHHEHGHHAGWNARSGGSARTTVPLSRGARH